MSQNTQGLRLPIRKDRDVFSLEQRQRYYQLRNVLTIVGAPWSIWRTFSLITAALHRGLPVYSAASYLIYPVMEIGGGFVLMTLAIKLRERFG